MTYNANNTISGLIESQLPGFIREDNPLFVSFLEAYYEYMEQANNSVLQGKTVERSKNLLNYRDVDTTISLFSQNLYDEFLAGFPLQTLANKPLLVKNIKQFNKSKGTQKSFRFLFRALYGEEIDFVFPKDRVLRPSSGKWFYEQSIRVTNVTVNGVGDSSIVGLQYFTNTLITGSTSKATAAVERVLITYQNGIAVHEIFLSHQVGTFGSNETITTTDINGNVLSAQILAGLVISINIVQGGTHYNIGDPVLIQSNSGMGASAFVSSISPGAVDGVLILKSGAGFRVGDFIQFTGTTGSGANANVIGLAGTANSFYHPNTYTLNTDQISNFATITYNAASYGFPNMPTANANTPMINAYSTFSYGPTGPMLTILVFAGGNNYITVPTADVFGNTLMKKLCILGRLQINNGGTGYAVGENIEINNPTYSYGTGANAQIMSVAANGMIQLCQFQPVYGHYTGGEGFSPDLLPYSTNIKTANGVGANVQVVAALAYGSPETSLFVQTGTIGSIQQITLTSQGTGYNTAPLINLTQSGDGTAQATSNILTGTFTYPGYFLDDTGFPSGSNVLQDRDYFQNYSYVIKVRQSISQYRDFVKRLVHPAGTKLWGQYNMEEPNTNCQLVPNTGVYRKDLHKLVNAVSFDTAGSYLTQNTFFTNVQNGQKGTLSVWVNIDNAPANSNNAQLLFLGNTTSYPFFSVAVANNGVSNASSKYITVTGKDTTGNVILSFTSNTSATIISNNWIHILASWDLSNTNNIQLFLTNVSSKNVITFTANSNVSYNVVNTAVGAYANGFYQFDGCMAELWFDTSYTELANVQNRNLFITPALLPANMKSDGSGPTGTSPILYLRGNAATFNVNYGTGGNLLPNTALTVCASSPSDT